MVYSGDSEVDLYLCNSYKAVYIPIYIRRYTYVASKYQTILMQVVSHSK